MISESQLSEKKTNPRSLFFLGILPAFLPAAFTAWAVLRYAVYVLYWDDWTHVYLLSLFMKGTASLADFWAMSNEHRPFFPRLLFIPLMRLTRWDPLYGLVLNYFLAVSAWCVTVLMVWRERAALGEKNFLWLPGVIAVFIFSLRQSENWVWLSETVYFLPALLAAAAVYLLSQPVLNWKTFGFALACSLAASASFATGFILWPAGFLILCFAGMSRVRRLKALLLWTAAAVLMTGFYLQGYEAPPHHPMPLYRAGVIFLYLCHYLSSALTADNGSSFVPGLFGLLLFGGFCHYLFRSRLYSSRVTAAVSSPGVFAVLNGLLTAVGRAGFGVQQAMAPRYVTFSCYFWISLVFLSVLTARALENPNATRPKHQTLAVLPFVLCAAVTVQALKASWLSLPELARHQARVHSAAVQLLDHPADADLSPLFLNPANIQEAIQFLREEKMNVFDSAQEARLRKSVSSQQL